MNQPQDLTPLALTDDEIDYIEGYCLELLERHPNEEQGMLKDACAQAKRHNALRARIDAAGGEVAAGEAELAKLPDFPDATIFAIGMSGMFSLMIKAADALAALRRENSGLRSAWQQLRAEHEATLRQLIAAEDAAARARESALEEAAKVCEKRIGNGDYTMDSQQAAWDSEAQGCANFIRALTSKPALPADIKREGA